LHRSIGAGVVERRDTSVKPPRERIRYWKDWFENWVNGWWVPPDHVSQWIDQPCGAGFSPPNCFNGVYAAVDNWGANKP